MHLRADQGVFILAHLLEFVDTYQTSGELFLYHPGDHITISGYFMDNSGNPSGVHLKITSQDASSISYSNACSIV